MRRTITILAAALAVTACATSYEDDMRGNGPRYGGYAYDGHDYGRSSEPYRGSLRGPGVEILDPWLRDTEEGREVVTLGFRDAVHGEVSEDVAHRANIWFRRHADVNRDMRLTDLEIRLALANSAAFQRHLRSR